MTFIIQNNRNLHRDDGEHTRFATDGLDGACRSLRQGYGCVSDYHLVMLATAVLARSEAICKTRRFSDHAPLVIDHDFTL